MPSATFPSLRPRGTATPVIALEAVDSTNSEAARRAAGGDGGPLWITAQRQARGKGRSGRSFQSPPGGNLYASLLLTVVAPAAKLHQMSLLAGVAAIDAIRAACGSLAPPGLRLKWPNDILIGDAKLCGILTESSASSGVASASLVVGWGINLATHPANLDRPATSLAAHGVHVTPEDMLGCLDAAFFRWFDIWAGGDGFGIVRAGWLERAGRVGERLICNAGSGALIEGSFVGLDDDGALLLADGAGQARRVTYGDVALPGPSQSSAGQLRS